MKHVGYMVDTEQGQMFWPLDDYDEALTYCDDDEFPIKLYAGESNEKVEVPAP